MTRLLGPNFRLGAAFSVPEAAVCAVIRRIRLWNLLAVQMWFEEVLG
jgi:hypothetical protein